MKKYLLVLLISLLVGCEKIVELKKYEITRTEYENWSPKHPKIENKVTVMTWIEESENIWTLENKYSIIKNHSYVTDNSSGIRYTVAIHIEFLVREL